MESDFAAAQVHLRAARRCLQGQDKVTDEAAEALDLLIVAVATAEMTRDQSKIIPFPRVETERFRTS